MAIDYTIDYACIPKQRLTGEGILARLKGRARAQAVIDLFRRSGDNRPPGEIGFELTRSTAEGAEETRVVMVQDLLDQAEELSPLEHFCEGCPANGAAVPFGCIGQIEYPISGRAEIWLLNQLPSPDEPLPWLLLRQGLEEMKRDGSSINAMRGEGQPYFQERGVLARGLGEYMVNSNQVFEMLFLSGNLKPSYAAMLLLFFKAIRRDGDASEIMNLSKSPEDAFERYPFLLQSASTDDSTLRQFRRFFHALYLAWGLNVVLLLDV